MTWPGVLSRAALRDFTNNLHITRHPYIHGVTFYTRGPKPASGYFWRQWNGVTILVGPDKITPFGWVDFEAERTDAVIVVPLIITLAIQAD